MNIVRAQRLGWHACLWATVIQMAVPLLNADVIWVADFLNSRVTKYSMSGAPIKHVKAFYPTVMTGDAFGNLFVKTSNNEIMKISPAGGVLKRMWYKNASPVDGVNAMACDHEGNLYVANWGDNSLEKFSASGVHLGMASATGIANSTGMTSDRNGYLYAANITGIQKFAPGGQNLGTFVSGIFQAKAMACDRHGNLYVAVPGSNIRRFSSAGAYLGVFCDPAFDPAGLAFDGSGNLYAANNTGLVEKFSPAGASLGFISLSGVGLAMGIVVGTSYEDQAGAFVGMFDDGDGSLGLTLAQSGSFTGKVTLAGGATVTIKGSFDKNGYFSGVFGSAAVAIELQIVTSGDTLGDISITGEANGSAVTAYHTSYQSGQMPEEAGKYTLLMKPTQVAEPVPQGIGYGTFTVGKSGAVKMAGKLADNTSFTAAGPLVGSASGNNEFVIFNASLYRKKGALTGRSRFANLSGSDCSGSIQWIKPITTGALAAGFDTEISLIGARYTPPAAGAFALPVANLTAELSGGDLAGAVNTAVALSSNNKITVTGANDLLLKMTVNARSGSMSGSFSHPGSGKLVKFQGVLYQNPNQPQAGGYFIGPPVSGVSKSGRISVLP